MATFDALFTFLFLWLFHETNGCSIAYPENPQPFISNVQLLDETRFPDHVLLTISQSGSRTGPPTPAQGPWCKLMSTVDGSVGRSLDCDSRRWARLVREYTNSNTESTTVTCNDNCDGSTATCTITRNRGEVITIPNIPYSDALSGCITLEKTFTSLVLFTAFTIDDRSTTYIAFANNMVGIVFDDTVSPSTYKIYDVHRMGDWTYISPGQWFPGEIGKVSVYPNTNVLRVPLPCCLCHGHKLISYTIETDEVTMSQVFTLTSLGFGGGSVDALRQKVINQGLYFSKAVTVYDLNGSGESVSFEPDLCEFIAECLVSPCDNAACPMNSDAVCVPDYCGGCNAKWFCGTADVTAYCENGPSLCMAPELSPPPVIQAISV